MASQLCSRTGVEVKREMEKKPSGVSGLSFLRILLALGALAIHRPGLEAALFETLEDLVFGEADVRFDPHVRYESALHVAINGLPVNP